MKANKKHISVVAIFAIIGIALTVVTIVLPIEKSASVICVYSFSMFTIVFAGVMTVYALGRPKKLISKFLGYPLYRLVVIYMVIQLILAAIVYAVQPYYEIPVWITISVSIVLLGFFAICCITAENVRDVIEEIDSKETQSIESITFFQLDIADMVDSCQVNEVRSALKSLQNKLKYSDPVSSPETIEKENQIRQLLGDLKKDLNKKQADTLLDQIRIIGNLVESRNRICERSK